MAKKWEPSIPMMISLFLGAIGAMLGDWALAWAMSAFLLMLCTGEVVTAIKERN